MVSGVNNIEQGFFQPQISNRQKTSLDAPASITSFDAEDEAIISAEAKLLSETEKFNSGEGNLVDLAVACVVTKNTVLAQLNVIQTKKDIIDDLLEMVE